jgi:hypothetical protein
LPEPKQLSVHDVAESLASLSLVQPQPVQKLKIRTRLAFKRLDQLESDVRALQKDIAGCRDPLQASQVLESAAKTLRDVGQDVRKLSDHPETVARKEGVRALIREAQNQLTVLWHHCEPNDEFQFPLPYDSGKYSFIVVILYVRLIFLQAMYSKHQQGSTLLHNW